MKLAVLAFPDLRPLNPTTAIGRAVGKLVKVGRFKRNARTSEYMKSLAAEHLGPECEFVDAGPGLPERLARASEVVLLWPDGNGYGWSPVERAVLGTKNSATRVFVLNGRRRYFELTPPVLRAFRTRRVLARFWIGEILIASALLLISPGLVAWDWARGRR